MGRERVLSEPAFLSVDVSYTQEERRPATVSVQTAGFLVQFQFPFI